MPLVSNYVLNNRGNFHLQLLRRFKDIAVFVVGSFLLPHPVQFRSSNRSFVVVVSALHTLRLHAIIN